MNKVFVFILAVICSTIVYSDSFEGMMVPPNQLVDGKPINEYVNIWWQWTYIMADDVNPVKDLTGQNCHQGQFGSVWFLAGGFGSSTIRRKCEIPQGKYVFFPVINMVYWPPENGYLSCEGAKKYAALNNDDLISIEIKLDSMSAANPAHTRMASEKCFDLLGLVPKNLNPPKVYPAATDGYWVMLKPLAKGRHVLKFQAKYDGENDGYSKMAQDIEYEITVK
jgi:hypothetical protein